MYGLLKGIEDVRDYIFGSSVVPFIHYEPDGNWEPYLPKYESQSTRFETHGCTVWGAQNQIETLIKRLYDVEPNYSERFNYLLTPVTPGRGADPQKAYECIRKDGLIDQALLPMTDTLEEFLDQTDLTGSLKARGLNWLERHDFRHEWLWRQQPENWKDLLRLALASSPIAVTVTAWYSAPEGYIDNGEPNNHWCVLYRIDDDGSMWVFDSYDHSKKRLHPDHNIGRAKRIWINRTTRGAMRKHIGILEFIKRMLLNKRTLVDVANARLGTDVSPKDLAKDEVGCAESITNLMKEVWPETPIITGTWTLFDYLRKPTSSFVRTTVPTPGTIIICPTEQGKPFPGHVGIFMEDMTIASNDSATGRFIKNYDLKTWMARWVEKGGYKVYLFDHV